VTTILSLDLETVGDADAGRRVFGLEGSDAEVRAAMRAKRLEDTDGRSDFHKPGFWQVAAVGLVRINVETMQVHATADAGTSERSLIALADLWIEKPPRPTLVTWNGNSFDLSVLRYRALLRGLPLRGLYGPPNQRRFDSFLYRYGDAHVDLMDELAGHGASKALSLMECGRLCGLPVKTAADGSRVEELYEAGEWPQMKDYVLEDSLDTVLLFLRFEVSRGRISRTQFEGLVAAVGIACPPGNLLVRQACERWARIQAPAPVTPQPEFALSGGVS
jgi:3'-5' exonuclease